MKTAPLWARVVLAGIAAPQLITGAWAIVSPRHWYDTFPGFGPVLVAAEPPFNAHLATDAGAGLFATALVAVIAAYWGGRRLMALGGTALAAFAFPHLYYHALNPAPGLSTTANAVNVVVLAVVALLPLVVVVASLNKPRKELVR